MRRFRTMGRGVIPALFFLVLLGGCAKKEPIVVARIGHEEILTLEALKKSFSKGKSEEALMSVELSALKSHLDGMIDERLKVLVAYERGLDKDSTVVEKVHSARQRLLLRKLYDTEIVDRHIKESEIRAFYDKTGREVDIRTIFFRVRPTATPAEEEEVRKRSNEVLEKVVRASEDFAQMAQKFSEDKQTAMVTTLSWNRSDDPIREAAFSLREGEISEPVRNDMGYHIVKVEEIRKVERKPYEKARVEIRNYLVRKNREFLQQEANAYWQEVQEKRQLQWCEDELAWLANRMKPVPDTKRSILDTLSTFGPGERAKILVRYRGGEMSIQEFEKRFRNYGADPLVLVSSVEALKDIIDHWLVADILSAIAVEKGLDRDENLLGRVRTIQERAMVNLLLKREVFEESDPREEAIKAYYRENKEKRYSEPEKRKVQEVMVSDKELAYNVITWVKSGEDFGLLARKLTERHGYKHRDGILPLLTKGKYGIVGEKAFDLQVGEMGGPFWDEEKQKYSVIKVLERKPMRIKPFSKVKASVKGDLKQHLREERERAWLDTQRQEHPVEVDEGALERLLAGFKES